MWTTADGSWVRIGGPKADGLEPIATGGAGEPKPCMVDAPNGAGAGAPMSVGALGGAMGGAGGGGPPTGWACETACRTTGCADCPAVGRRSGAAGAGGGAAAMGAGWYFGV